MTDKLTIEIDGRVCEASPGEMIIQVADREGIAIPRFCYHEKLSIAANCRMCLVQAEAGGRPFPKPVPACATPVANAMKVRTRSSLALEAQQGTMEFLLINHPLDCPICDQGGECELQDVAMGYGDGVSRFSERKRVVADEDLGPLIATEMTRCIHCTRCVRFGAEIAGVRELGATGRGEDMRIGTYVAHTVSHELSGNVIDLCPVGALTSKPYRYQARAWELTTSPSIACHDAVGSNIQLHIRRNEILRVHPRDNEAVNETWISDRDRFSYEGLASEERLTTPLVKRDGEWHAIGWQEALNIAAEALKESAPESLGGLIAPNATLEEMYLFQALVRGLDSANVDSRLRRADVRSQESEPLLPWLGTPIAELETRDSVLLVGADIRQEQPLLAHRIRKAALDGASVAVVNPYALSLTFPATQLVTNPSGMVEQLAAIAAALETHGTAAVSALIAKARPSAEHKVIAEQLFNAERGLILLGALSEAHPDYGTLQALAQVIATASGDTAVGYLPAAANSVGAHLAGALPHVSAGASEAETVGLSTREMLEQPCRTWFTFGIDPDMDLGAPSKAMAAFDDADFVIACSAFASDGLARAADLLLPISAFAETSGTFVNAEGLRQSFRAAVKPPGDVRPGWKVLRVLGNLLGLDGFEQDSSEDVRSECLAATADVAPSNAPRGELASKGSVHNGKGLTRIGNVPIYAVDGVVRRAGSLQRTPAAEGLVAVLHPTDAASLGLAMNDRARISQGGKAVEAPVVVDETIAVGCVRIPAGVAGSERLGDQIGAVTIEKV